MFAAQSNLNLLCPSSLPRGVCSLLLPLLLLGTLLPGTAAANPAAETMREDLEKISAEGKPRGPGQPANRELAEKIQSRFEASGYESGTLNFTTPHLQPGSVTISLPEGETFDLEPMHPSLMNPGNFPREGFKARLVYLGHGTYEDVEKMNGQALDGTVAVMEYDSGRNWMRLLRLGVRGVIFLGAENPMHHDAVSKVYNTEVGVPRLYLPSEQTDRLRSKLTAENTETMAQFKAAHTRWESGELTSPWVLIEGTDPDLRDEVIVFTAPLDANSVVPARATGAHSAPNLNLLMKLYDDFLTTPPSRSVMLVAVNAHTRQYLGERILAWSLLADRSNVSKMRNQIGDELREAELYWSNYSKLGLEGTDMDPDRLHVVMEMLWQLNDKQSARREQEHKELTQERIREIKELAEEGANFNEVELEAVEDVDHELDLTEFEEKDYRRAIEAAIKKLEKQTGGIRSLMVTDEEVVKGVEEDIERLRELKKKPYEELRALAERAKPVFDDEKLFERWRTELDRSTGVRLAVKSKLQDEASRVLNRQKLKMMDISTNEELTEEEKESKLEEMRERTDDYRNVLILFNKIDVGVGRSRTYYREIANNDRQLDILRGYRDRLVAQFERNMKQKQEEMDRDRANDAIRDAVGARQVQLVLSLDVNWASPEKIGFCTLNKDVKNSWQRGFGQLSEQIASSMDAQEEPAALNLDEDRPLTPTAEVGSFASKDWTPFVNTLSQAGGLSERYYFLSPHHPASVFHRAAATPAMTLRSVHAGPGPAFGPNDTMEQLDMDACARLTDWLRRYFSDLVDHPETVSTVTNKKLNIPGQARLWASLLRTFKVDQFSSQTTPSLEVPNCMMAIYPTVPEESAKFLSPIIGGDVLNAYTQITDAAAQAVVYGIQHRETLAPAAYQMDGDFTRVLHTIDKGQIQSSMQMMSNLSRGSYSKTLPMFKGLEFPVYDRIDPSTLSSSPITVQELWPMAASRKAEPQKYGLHGVGGLTTALSPPTLGPAAIYRWQRDVGLSNEPMIVLTDQKHGIMNPTKLMPDGAGYAAPEQLKEAFFAIAARDMHKLNRMRMAEMKGVSDQLVEEFLDDGKIALAEMDRAAESHDHNSFLEANYRALGNVAKAYDQLRSINSDMLSAILVYMALMLPFCFFLQKLLFKFERIEHELLVFLSMFVGLYVCFRFIHPAFALAMSAEAIFIGFLLAAVGLFTIWVLHARFKGEMNLLFQNYTGMEAEVSYSAVGQTAMLIGVNNMKRRRIRTGLTTATIVLVTFAMLAFSSVSKKMKPTVIPQRGDAPYAGLFYHWPGGQPMDEASAQIFRDLYADEGDVIVRRIITPPKPEDSDSSVDWNLELVDSPAAGRHINVEGVMGLPMEDEDFLGPFPVMRGDYFSAPDAHEIMLTASAADGMGIAPDQVGEVSVRFMGQKLRVAGIVEDERYRLMRDLDPGFRLYPLDQDSGLGGAGQQSVDEGPSDRSAAVGIDTARLVFLPVELSKKLGGEPFSVSVRLPVDAEAETNEVLWPQLTRLLKATRAKVYIGSPMPFAVGTGDQQASSRAGTYYVGSSYRTSIGGFSNVLIPLIIAGTIILNTMLGTVYERKQEIAVYNAIGLNPTHIFMFFLGEAFVYSVIGSVSGYLIGQILAIVMKSLQIVEGVNINFSSLMVVYAIMLTIALVLLSTVYPAVVATRTAVPSGKRTWSMPDNDGDKMRNVFPFIYQPNLASGVMYYLFEFFSTYTEQSFGDMIAHVDGHQLDKDEDGRPLYRLSYTIALAPFDLGVTQRVTFMARYDTVVQSYRIHMLVERLSGQDTNWATTNKPFMEGLRKLLLRWRNLDSTQHRWYEDEGKSLFGLDDDNNG